MSQFQSNCPVTFAGHALEGQPNSSRHRYFRLPNPAGIKSFHSLQQSFHRVISQLQTRFMGCV
jgi:hypothetical protein